MLGREPVLWMALVQAIIAVGTAFGLGWTGEQVGTVTALAAAILAFVSRSQVTPNVKLPVIVLCIVLGGATMLSACATRADGTKLSPEGTIAYRGTAVVNALSAAAPALEALTLPHSCGERACLTAGEALQIATGVRDVLGHAQQLPPILTTIDTATSAAAREQGLGKARAIIAELIKTLNAGMVLPTLPEARVKVVAILQTAQLALVVLGGL